MSSTRSMRKSVLSIAMGLCLSSLALAPAYAQSATGSVAGRATAGDQISIVNSATGASRTVTVGADGSYRMSQLPVGDYSLQVMRGGQGALKNQVQHTVMNISPTLLPWILPGFSSPVSSLVGH